MTTLDQKRMLKLAGLLKEGVEEWIDETAPDMEKVPHADVDADLDIPMGYAPGEDQSDDRKEDLYSLYSDMYKEINGVRPRWVRPEEFVELAAEAKEIGFLGVMSGPLVRSSYRAGRLYKEAMAAKAGVSRG
jgi:hypothetical protein